ncbi:HK97 family phage prohead protease [Cryobacterium melibiosiphilum]|uniref:HK97 family phage prohead protease n=2 Tax=Cryobacterium melibiosiphilum TaxID=995039 RepID=A0A3A5MDC0_9MICO|nr:HK97 family phage prohead protease [Cryobacterium melibiosiphilum]
MPGGGLMKTKSFTVDLKTDGLAEGQFEGYAAIFGNKDSYGDIIVAGAFAESLADYGPKGAGVPCYWAHQMNDPYMNIGVTVEAKEDDRGLFVRVQLDLETNNAKQTQKLLREGRVTMMSFAYDVIEGAYVDSEEKGFYYELRKLKLHEVSVVPIGANQETEILSVKSATELLIADIKSGRPLSAQSEGDVRAAHEALGQVLKTVTSDEKSSGAPEVKDEEPSRVKSEELTGAPALRDMTAQLTIYALGQKGDQK